MIFPAPVLNRCSLIVLSLAVLLAVDQATAGPLVIDFSPDTTAATATFNTGGLENDYNGQIIGDLFTLSENTYLMGGAIFSDAEDALQNPVAEVGDPVRFLIFSDSSGTPSATPIVDITTTLDAVDTAYTTSVASLTRKHASITPTLLSAGTYWFTMPGIGFDVRQAITTSDGYDNNSYRRGTTNLSGGSGTGDMYFQLETVPEPSLLLLAASGLSCLLLRRPRR